MVAWKINDEKEGWRWLTCVNYPVSQTAVVLLEDKQASEFQHTHRVQSRSTKKVSSWLTSILSCYGHCCFAAGGQTFLGTSIHPAHPPRLVHGHLPSTKHNTAGIYIARSRRSEYQYSSTCTCRQIPNRIYAPVLCSCSCCSNSKGMPNSRYKNAAELCTSALWQL